MFILNKNIIIYNKYDIKFYILLSIDPKSYMLFFFNILHLLYIKINILHHGMYEI